MANSQMLTANRLRDGDVVYWRAGGWVEAFDQGDVFAAEADAEAALRAAGKFVADNVVVNPYLFDVRAEADGFQPVKEREIVRAAGPSVREDLGKQASGRSPPPARLREELRRATSPRGGGERDDDVSI
jgi:hypothetical protein